MKNINLKNNKKIGEQEQITTNWLTRKQARSYLQCSLSLLDSRLPIKKYYLNKNVRYLKSDLDSYLLSHCKEPNFREEYENK